MGSVANDTPLPLHVRAFEYPNGYQGHQHQHRLHQLVYPIRGIVQLETESTVITISPYRAVAIPSWLPHRLVAQGNTSLRSVFIDPTFQKETNQLIRVLEITPLLHELISAAGQYYGEFQTESVVGKVLSLIADLLLTSKTSKGYIHLPRIHHPRLRPCFDELQCSEEARPGDLLVDPMEHLSATSIAKRVALSPRQFRRVFKQDTGITFKDWRALFRLQKAAAMMAEGHRLTTIAHRLNLSSASALSDLFRKQTGMTPTQFAAVQR